MQNRLLKALTGSIFLLPIIALVLKIFEPNQTQNPSQFFLKLLPEYLINSILLVTQTTIISCVMGITIAFILNYCDIPYKKIFKIITILPLGFPLYIGSFIYIGIFDYSGAIPTFFREFFAINIKHIFNIKSSFGISLIFSLFVTPYMIILCERAFNSLGHFPWVLSQSMGKSTFTTITKIILPSSMPWILSACAIISMETLADFGGVSAFNYDTLTTGIYTAWTGLYSFSLAVKLALILLLFAICFLLFEEKFASKKGFVKMNKQSSHKFSIQLNITQKLICTTIILIYITFSLIIPIFQLLYWSINTFNMEWSNDYIELIKNTVYLGVIGAPIILFGSLIHSILFINRKGKFERSMLIIGLLGYSIPGPIIALALYSLGHFIIKMSGLKILLTGNIVILIIAYYYRFNAIGFRGMDSGLKRLNKKYDLFCRLSGISYFKKIFSVYIPLLKNGISFTFLLLFIEIIKEMPLTLMLRPLNINTLPVKIYELTSEGEWERSAIAGILLIMITLPLTFYFTYKNDKLDERLS